MTLLRKRPSTDNTADPLAQTTHPNTVCSAALWHKNLAIYAHSSTVRRASWKLAGYLLVCWLPWRWYRATYWDDSREGLLQLNFSVNLVDWVV